MALPIPNRDDAAKSIHGMNVLPRAAYKYAKEFEPVYIYNVGRWAGENQKFWIRNSGTGHTFIIPLCPKAGDKHSTDYAAQLREHDASLTDSEIKEIVRGVKAGEHSMPCLIPDPVIEFYPTRLGSPPKSETWEGLRIAQEVVNLIPQGEADPSAEIVIPGVAAAKDPSADMRYWGIFIAEAKVPTAKEISEVQTWYEKRLTRLIEEANELARDNNTKAIRRVHRFAADALGIMAPWNRSLQELAEPKKSACPVCMNSIIEGAKKCQHCGEWLDGRNTTSGKSRA